MIKFLFIIVKLLGLSISCAFIMYFLLWITGDVNNLKFIDFIKISTSMMFVLFVCSMLYGELKGKWKWAIMKDTQNANEKLDKQDLTQAQAIEAECGFVIISEQAD